MHYFVSHDIWKMLTVTLLSCSLIAPELCQKVQRAEEGQKKASRGRPWKGQRQPQFLLAGQSRFVWEGTRQMAWEIQFCLVQQGKNLLNHTNGDQLVPPLCPGAPFACCSCPQVQLYASMLLCLGFSFQPLLPSSCRSDKPLLYTLGTHISVSFPSPPSSD